MRCGEEGMGVRNIAGMLPGKGDAGRKRRGGGVITEDRMEWTVEFE